MLLIERIRINIKYTRAVGFEMVNTGLVVASNTGSEIIFSFDAGILPSEVTKCWCLEDEGRPLLRMFGLVNLPWSSPVS